VIATFAIEMLPDYDDVIARLSGELLPAGHIAVTGMRDPERWPEWLVRIGSALNSPFGVSKGYRHHRLSEATKQHTTSATYTEVLGGADYLAAAVPHTDPPRPTRLHLRAPKPPTECGDDSTIYTLITAFIPHVVRWWFQPQVSSTSCSQRDRASRMSRRGNLDPAFRANS
jgi:hypothetical protein